MAELPSGTVTFLFTDLVDSTRLWEEHPEAMPTALARHDDIVRTAIAAHDGELVKTTVLAHPLLFHSSNVNHGTRPRVMAQPRFDVTEAKRTHGADLSPVEATIARARP